MAVMIVVAGLLSGTMGAGVALASGWVWWVAALVFVLAGNLAAGFAIGIALLRAAGNDPKTPKPYPVSRTPASQNSVARPGLVRQAGALAQAMGVSVKTKLLSRLSP